MCLTILIVCQAVMFAEQSGYSSVLYFLDYLVFPFPPTFLEIKVPWWLSLMAQVSLQQQKGSFWFQKCCVTSLDPNETFTLIAFPNHAGFFCLVCWFGWMIVLKVLDLSCVDFSHYYYAALWSGFCLHLQQWTVTCLYTISSTGKFCHL